MPDRSREPPFWDREVHAARRPKLLARARAAAAVRGWFAARDFVEVEPDALQTSPGNETHLSAFSTTATGLDGARRPLHLHTSPEFAMKKLLAAGEERIFSLARVFRDREGGPLHAPEFSMLEWYRVGASLDAIAADCAEICAEIARACGGAPLRWRGREADPCAPARVVTLEAAFAAEGLGLAALMDGGRDAFADALVGKGLRIGADDTWSDLFSRALVEWIEPKLGVGRLDVLARYPVSEAALARPCADDPRFSERFELYACGVELANAFGELTDAAEQRRRFEADMAERRRIYGDDYPIDEDFLAALATMPDSAGCALGFDRVVALATGARDLAEINWAPTR